MAIALNGLPCISPFDSIGEPATLEQRWTTWKDEFLLYVAASGVSKVTQKRAILLHLAGPGVREIFKTYDEDIKGKDDDFDKALKCLSEHFKLKKNVPKARQTFLSTKPNPGETINNYVTRLKSLVEHCEYGDEKDNQHREVRVKPEAKEEAGVEAEDMEEDKIELDPESRHITTFAGPNGLYRYKRLLFGVNMASEKFQHIMWQILKDCPGAHNIHDDVRVVGSTEEEHDERLERVLTKLEENNLTLNYKKCEIGVTSMSYMGNILSDKGLEVSQEKVKAVTETPKPQNQAECRSFLGLAQFCAKFVPGFATITSPLWELTKKDAKWKWSDAEENAFQEVKRQLTVAPVMAYFKQGAKTRITTDASPVGLGAILEHQQH
ncbi:hypothetical protein QZH41_007092 [Actinostola sp. cb2023]|nr:hypothetical protein QZH41_007092 [Actinostola sp. cb2023]